jgi:hypothetical protein
MSVLIYREYGWISQYGVDAGARVLCFHGFKRISSPIIDNAAFRNYISQII